MKSTFQEEANAHILLAEIIYANSAFEMLLAAGKSIELEETSLKKSSLENITFESSGLSYKAVRKLIDKARKARDLSYAPYSHFNVGAAILAENREMKEKTFTGCNVENAAYGSTICAERTTVFKAVSEGYRNFLACAIVGGFDYSMPEELREAVANEYIPPCGSCRQVLNEFRADPFYLIFAKDSGDILLTTIEYFLPCGFGPKSLGIDAAMYDRLNN